mmetsp:Transcript_32567/g.74932  ORF Transcript_32567/g.74932 Transcript_32567/m.74932 type:complete len:177 (-) Transcript_32567:7-537(-)
MPLSKAELILDSQRVKVYNKLSTGRTDEMILQSDIDTNVEDGKFGPGETKIVRNLTKPPFVKRSIELVSLMHCRRVVAPGSPDPSYVIVTRAVNQRPDDELVSESAADRSRSEILTGANLVRPLRIGGALASDLTCVTHMNGPGIPAMLVRKIASTSARNFVQDLRSALENAGRGQ